MKNLSIQKYVERLSMRRGAIFGGILFTALLAFEVFNYSTTEFALRDMLGTNAGLRWSVVLAIAFCGIDFAGIARLFTPEQGRDEPAEVWYLFGAWLLAAAMNAMLTWWGVSVAITNHTPAGSAIVTSQTLVKVVPVFVALMVWLIRILIIGTFAIAGERLFSMSNDRPSYRPAYQPQPRSSYAMTRPAPSAPRPRPAPASASIPLTTARALMNSERVTTPPARSPVPSGITRPEPTYHPVSLAASALDEDSPVRR
jgi:hypothetical protein